MTSGQSQRMVSVDFADERTIRPVLGAVMERLPQVRLECITPEENGDRVTVLITVLGDAGEPGFFLDEAEETFQDELDSLGLKISLHLNDDDWGTE